MSGDGLVELGMVLIAKLERLVEFSWRKWSLGAPFIEPPPSIA